MPVSPLLAQPSLKSGVPLSVASTTQASANAALCRFLINAGAVRENDLPDGEADPLKACQHAIDAWIKRQIGPLHCLQPRFAINVLDEHGHHPATREGRQAPYAQLDVYWCEYSEAEWPVGRSLEALNEAMPHLGATVLQVLRRGACLGKQLVPVIRGTTALQHPAEYPIGVVAALVGALGVFIVDPREHDHLAGCVVAEE